MDYRRLYITHQTIGYSEHAPGPVANAPADDGIHALDLDSGDHRLLVSYAELRNFHPRASMEHAIHWVSHIEVNPSSTRILFLHRWTERVEDETCFLHRLITMNPDGSDMRLLECSDHPLPQLAADFDPNAVGTFDYEKSEYQISHPLWRDDRSIIVWGPHAGSIHYHLYEDADGGQVQVVGNGILTENGHMTFSPVDTRWLLSDTYPDPVTHERILFLYDMRTGQRHDLGSFYADPALSKETAATCIRAGAATAPRSASIPCTKASGRCTCWTWARSCGLEGGRQNAAAGPPARAPPQPSRATWRSACSNTSAGWPPDTRYLPLRITDGTDVMPRSRQSASSLRTSSA